MAPHLLTLGFVTDLGQRRGEVVAVLVHQVVGVATEILPQLFHDFIHVVLCEVCGAQNDGLPVGRAGRDGRAASVACTYRLLHTHTHLLEFEGLPQLGRIAWVDLEDPAERVRVTPVCKFCGDDGAEVKQRVVTSMITRERVRDEPLQSSDAELRLHAASMTAQPLMPTLSSRNGLELIVL